jgi:hypothetical protein
MTVATLDEAVRPAVTFTVRIKRTPSGASRAA